MHDNTAGLSTTRTLGRRPKSVPVARDNRSAVPPPRL